MDNYQPEKYPSFHRFGGILSPPQARQELNPSQVSAYLRITREPREVDGTCISGDSLKGSAGQIIRIVS